MLVRQASFVGPPLLFAPLIWLEQVRQRPVELSEMRWPQSEQSLPFL